MTPEEQKAADLQKQLEATKEELASAKAVASLTDAEKVLYGRLTPDAQRGFLRLDPGARRREVEKTAEENPVVYTADNGEVFRKSDDPRLVRLAKQNDESIRSAKIEREARENVEFAKRAETELKNLPGDPATKVAMLRAVEGIKDDGARKGCSAMLKAGNEALAFEFDVQGIKNGGPTGDSHAQLEALAEAFAKKNNISITQARSKVLDTPEAAEIVTRMRAGVQ